jgi:thiamine kinase-like enzyme
LSGKTIKLLDWDSASPQNLYFDLATCTLFYYYYDEDNLYRELLTQYLQRKPSEVEENKYYMMIIFAYIYFGIGFVTIYPNLKSLSDKECQTLPSFSEIYRI